MHADRDFDFSVSMLAEDRWVIIARGSDDVTTMLAGVYFSEDAALGALSKTSMRWLSSLPAARNAIAA